MARACPGAAAVAAARWGVPVTGNSRTRHVESGPRAGHLGPAHTRKKTIRSDEDMAPRLHGTRSVLPLLIILAVAACGSDSGDPTGPDTLMATLSGIQAQNFDRACSPHHGPGSGPAEPDLSPGQSFSNLVDVRSAQVGLNRVTPGDAENSFLVHKIEGRAGIAGNRMANAANPLTAAETAAIGAWINAKARNN